MTRCEARDTLRRLGLRGPVEAEAELRATREQRQDALAAFAATGDERFLRESAALGARGVELRLALATLGVP